MSAEGGRCPDAIVRADVSRRRQRHRHRAARVARARRRRGPRRGARAQHRPGRPLARPRHEDARLPQRARSRRRSSSSASGREAVLDEAIRATLGRWYVDADRADRHPPGRRPGPRRSATSRRRGRAAGPSRFEIGVRPKATLGTYKGLEVAAARAAGRRGGVDRPDRRAARAHAPPRDRRGRGRRGRLRRHGLRRHARRRGRAVRGRHRRRPAHRARVRPPDPRLRGAAVRRERRRRAHGRR